MNHTTSAMLGGALIGLVVALVVIGVFWVIAKNKTPSFDLPVSRSESFTAGLAPAAAIAKLREAQATMGLTLALDDAAGDRVILEERASLNSYGNFLAVSAVGEGGGSTVTVGLMNKAPQWGPVVTKKHRKLADKVRGALGVAAG